MSRKTLQKLPPDIVLVVLEFLPVLDFYNLKLAGNRYITEVVWDFTSRLPRAKYLRKLCEEDAWRNRDSLPGGYRRPALQIMIERRQEVHLRRMLKKYTIKGPFQVPKPVSSEVYHYPYRTTFNPDNFIWHRGYKALGRALWWTARYGSMRIVRLLLGIHNVHCIVDNVTKRTALHIAAMNGRPEVVKILLEYGAVTDLPDAMGQTPLGLALKWNHDDVAIVLRRRRAAVDFNDDVQIRLKEWMKQSLGEFNRRADTSKRTPPHLRGPGLQPLQILQSLEYFFFTRSNPQTTDKLQRALMDGAMRFNLPTLARLVLRNNFDTTIPLNKSGETALFVAQRYEHDKLVRLLLKDRSRKTIGNFRWAIFDQDTKTLKSFLGSGFFPLNARESSYDRTILHTAALRGKASVVTFILGLETHMEREAAMSPPSSQASSHTPNSRPSPCLPKDTNQNPTTTRADINARDRGYRTPLHYAAKFGQVAMVLEFLEHGADITAHDCHGFQALDVARDGEIAKIIIECGGGHRNTGRSRRIISG